MDLGLAPDLFDSFLKYQGMMLEAFKRLQSTYRFTMVDGHRGVDDINAELRNQIEHVLEGSNE
jgi:dTMP kinase